MKNTSYDRYEKRLKEGYGLVYPDGHVIRVYEKYIKGLLPKCGRMLDFGCWTGTHALYFLDKGFEVAGVDIIDGVIEQAKILIPEYADHFHVIDNNTILTKKYQPKSFDLIFTNQVLYFLPTAVFHKRVGEFHTLLKPGGLIFATWMSRKNFMAKSENFVMLHPNGLEEVVSHNIGGNHFTRFAESKKHLEQQFCLFEKLMIGSYDIEYEEESGHHYMYLGVKVWEGRE